MTVQPVLCFHVVTGFCIDITAAREHRYKQISAAPLSGNGIVDRDCISGPVHLDCISRFVLNAHDSFRHSCPFAVFVTALSAHVRRAAAFIEFAAVFFPKKRQRNAGLCKLTVDVRIIGFNIQTNIFVFVRKEHPLQICIRNIIIDRPADAQPVCSFKYCLACFSRCNLIAFHFALTAFLTSKHKNFHIVRHFLKALLESSHGFSARASFIIRENHQSGKLLRHSGGKSPASWQEKSVSVAKLIRFMHWIPLRYPVFFSNALNRQ